MVRDTGVEVKRAGPPRRPKGRSGPRNDRLPAKALVGNPEIREFTPPVHIDEVTPPSAAETRAQFPEGEAGL
jgi:hypothetical protein